MKKSCTRLLLPLILSCLLCQINSTVLPAQTFQVDTILYNGNPSKFINLVFLGDGFQPAEFPSYTSNVQNFTDFLFNTSPFKEYVNYFNVFAINVPSVESGADHPGTATDVSEPVHPVSSVNTYFNSTFDVSSIHRLLVPGNFSAVNNVLINNFPQYDQQLLLVNSPYYGGSGGGTATASLNTSSFEVMIHELGHSFAGLADEYYAGDGYAGERVNMTKQTDLALVKWKNWIGVDGVGIYQHCCGGNSAQWYRPHQGCKMRFLGPAYPFCPVCKEALFEQIHQKFGSPVLSYQPASNTVSYCSEPLSFKLNAIKPIPNTLKITWTLNGANLPGTEDSIVINAGQLNTGANALKATLLDTTALTRSDAHFLNHANTLSWTIDYTPVQTPVITANGPTTVCEGQYVLLTASPAGAYSWSNGAATSSIQADSAGDYSVTVTYGNGCSAASAATSVTVHPAPTPVISANGATAFCAGDSVILTSGPAESYVWSTGATTQSVTVTESGIYTVAITDANACSAASSETPVTVYPAPAAPFISGTDSTLVSSAASGNQWYLNGNLIAGAGWQTYVPTQSGIYTVVFTDNNACSAASGPYNFTITGTKDLEEDTDIVIVPNPNNGKFRIRARHLRSGSVIIFNSSGGMVYQSEILDTDIDLSREAKGSYIVEIRHRGKTYTRRLILQ